MKHVITTVQVLDKDLCELRCYLEHNCVSFNFKVKMSAEGTFSCELNDATHLEQNGDFISTKYYDYQGGEVRTILIKRFQYRCLQPSILPLFSIPSRYPPC